MDLFLFLSFSLLLFLNDFPRNQEKDYLIPPIVEFEKFVNVDICEIFLRNLLRDDNRRVGWTTYDEVDLQSL